MLTFGVGTTLSATDNYNLDPNNGAQEASRISFGEPLALRREAR